jgi:uncharacterized protein YqeY
MKFLENFKMTTLDTIKKQQLAARKARQTATATILTTLIGEIESFGKNQQREVTELEQVNFVKKFLKGVNDTIALVKDEAKLAELEAEKTIYEQFLPKQLTGDELKAVIDKIILENNITTMREMGKVVKLLKDDHEGFFDGAMAAKIIKGLLA